VPYGRRLTEGWAPQQTAGWLKGGNEPGWRGLGTAGTPQGAVILALLANIYLHEVYDLGRTSGASARRPAK
jgi:hypothetical protein